ncbi:hypothetical protein [Nonomuraea sp. NPDC049028]|uniref:hypothetical protein n=1 Tax=Nonomuraea sp. NPDC049028 TaxID=3364348 RepID=UPI003717E009
MNVPDTTLRAYVAERARQLASERDEDGLNSLLEEIQQRINIDVAIEEDHPPLEIEEARYVLVVVEAWASVISDAMVRFYGPESPLKQTLAGWSASIITRLHQLYNVLGRALGFAGAALGAADFGISAGFPWGVSVSLSWPITP